MPSSLAYALLLLVRLELSMATSLVAGYLAAVLREVLPRSGRDPINASLIKALLINGADILSSSTSRFIPCDNSGFDRINLASDRVYSILY